jgi:hypothetical protein
MRKPLSLLILAIAAVGSLLAQQPATPPAFSSQPIGDYTPPSPQVSYPAIFSANLTNTFPYSMSGQLIFTSGRQDYQGSGAVIHRRSVLTAAHNLWDADQGWSYNIEFNRARDGRKIAKQAFSSRMFVLGGYQTYTGRFGAESLRAFAFDIGGLRFSTPPADGSFAGWKSDLRLLTGANYNICLGYGADTHSGDELLFVEPPTSFRSTYGAFLENTSLTFEGGMSGGPVFAELPDGSMRIAGIIVAGSEDPPAGGIRAINSTAAQFIARYLRY